MSERQYRLWPWPIRLLHWLLAASFVLAYLSGEEALWLHALAGHLIVLLIGLRLLGGLFSTTPAALDQLWITPTAVKAHLAALLALRPLPHHEHHPLDALNILALFSILLLLCVTGMALLALDHGYGWLMGFFPAGMVWHKWLLAGSHELLAQFSLLLVLLHVVGVLGQSLIDRRNLSRSMLGGIMITLHRSRGWKSLWRRVAILLLVLLPSLIELLALRVL